MLAGQKRGRRHQRHLIARHGGDKRRPQRHLGLPETDIAADQPVRRTPRRQIADNILDRGKLVVGLGKAEPRAELGEPARLRLQRLGARRHPLRRDLDKLLGHDPDTALDPCHPRLPGRAAKPVKLRIGPGAAIARQHLDIFHRQVQLVAAGIDDLKAIVRPAGGVDDDKPLIAADAMFGMNHEITFLKRTDLAQEVLAATAPDRGRDRRWPKISVSVMTRSLSVWKPASSRQSIR